MSHSMTKTSRHQHGIPCSSQPGPWLLPLQLSGSGRSANQLQHCAPLQITLGLLSNVPLFCRTGEYVLSPCHSCLWLPQPLINPSRESGSLTQWCNTSALMQCAAGKRRAPWLPGSLRQALAPKHDQTQSGPVVLLLFGHCLHAINVRSSQKACLWDATHTAAGVCADP